MDGYTAVRNILDDQKESFSRETRSISINGSCAFYKRPKILHARFSHRCGAAFDSADISVMGVFNGRQMAPFSFTRHATNSARLIGIPASRSEAMPASDGYW